MLFHVALVTVLLGLSLGQRQPTSDDERVKAVVQEVNDVYYTNIPTTWITRDVECPRTIRSVHRVQLKPSDLSVNVTIKDDGGNDAAEFCQSNNDCGSGRTCQNTETEEHIFIATVDRKKRNHVRRIYGNDIAFFGANNNNFELKITFPTKCSCSGP